MKQSRAPRSGKRTAFVPRLAYGAFGVGVGVIPLCVGCSDNNGGQTIGIEVYIPDCGFGDTATPGDAPSVGIIVGFADSGASQEASTVGIRPADMPDGGADTEAPDAGGDDGSRAASDASGD
jgi:hypothetical protein